MPLAGLFLDSTLEAKPSLGSKMKPWPCMKRRQQPCSVGLSPRCGPRNKRKLNTKKALSLLVHLRHIFLNQLFIPNLAMKNHKWCSMPPQPICTGKQNLCWWVKKSSGCLKMKNKKLQSSKFPNLLKAQWKTYSWTSQDDEIRTCECGNNRCISGHGGAFIIHHIQLLVSIGIFRVIFWWKVHCWKVGWFWLPVVDYLLNLPTQISKII